MMRGYKMTEIPRILETVTKKIAAAGSLPRPSVPRPSSSSAPSLNFQNEASMSTRDTSSFVALPGMSIEGVPEHMVSKLAPAGKHGEVVPCIYWRKHGISLAHQRTHSNDQNCVQRIVPLGMAFSGSWTLTRPRRSDGRTRWIPSRAISSTSST